MPELAVKIKTAPNKRSTAINGTSHHFFSCFEKRQNSFRSDHMIDLECKIYIRACKENLTCRVRSAGVTIRGFGRNLRLNVRPPWLRRYPRRGRRWQRHLRRPSQPFDTSEPAQESVANSHIALKRQMARRRSYHDVIRSGQNHPFVTSLVPTGQHPFVQFKMNVACLSRLQQYFRKAL